MATHCGQDGIIKVNEVTVAEVRSWSLSTAVETVDASHLGDDWKIHKPTQKSWHGSLSCFWDESDAQGQGQLALGKTVTLQLYLEGTTPPALSGVVLVTGIDYAGAHNGLVEATIAFQGTGALMKDGGQGAPFSKLLKSKMPESNDTTGDATRMKGL